MILKLCPGCLTSKPETDFAADASKRDGLQSQCRACRSKFASKPVEEPGPWRDNPKLSEEQNNYMVLRWKLRFDCMDQGSRRAFFKCLRVTEETFLGRVQWAEIRDNPPWPASCWEPLRGDIRRALGITIKEEEIDA